ncbi:MAG TPA: glycosyltransferase family 2 protein [Candidatus Andersenbacteria bacterium]|nr:glycosyltransferase family 2 protein [Candidatus Andersenbacteria bacterium]
MEKLLTIQVLGWNGAKHLRQTAEALSHVPGAIADIQYIDNASTDNSVAIMQEILPHADILKLEKNIGFAAAHNMGIAKCTTPFILTLDQDQEIIWDGIEKLLDAMQTNPKLGAVQGKLYRKNGEKIIDSAGIVHTLSLNGKERGSNKQDMGQYETITDLLAVTGGCGLYRVEALREVAQHNQIFDEQFFLYKEDVDLGWRLNNMGWQVRYIPVLVSYHARTLGKRGLFNWGLNLSAIQERITSPRTKWSLRNYMWMIAKNASRREIIFHWPFIKSRLSVFFILSLFSPDLFSVWKETWRGLKMMREKGEVTRLSSPT